MDDVIVFPKKSLHESCRMGRRIVVIKPRFAPSVIVNGTVTQFTNSVNSVSLPTD
jgi:hypothetical protein